MGLILPGLLPATGFAQSTTMPEGSKFDHFMDRLEILEQKNHDLNLTAAKPISRKLAAQSAAQADSFRIASGASARYSFSKVDQSSLQELLMNNSEWAPGDQSAFKSKHPIFNTFYTTQANFVLVRDKDFFLTVDPVIQQLQSKESGNDQTVFLNSKGVTLRGQIGPHLGFSTYLTDNQERGPQFVMDRISEFSAVPGAGYYKPFKTTAVDYFDARGSIYFDVWKYFSVQFGYDKNFIGNGYRSLFLSDNAAPYTFLKLNTHIWKFNYQNIFMELVSQHALGDYEYPKKYAVVHHLSFDATKWLNLGLYENIVYSRAQYFDFSYLNPVIFLVAAQQENGSPDKTTAGLDFKANIAHSFQFYGQLIIDEFVLDQIRHYSRGWWGNKQGLQLGAKYINAFGLKNLDLQLETNIVRPYTYAHSDSVSSFSHYNQPMAHPLGANFGEVIAIARYQPAYRWNVEGKIIYYKQGVDSAGVNFGSNILENYNTRPRDYGFSIGSGIPAKCINISGLVSWECRENLFLELSAMYRKYSVNDPSGVYKSSNSTTITAGIRMNMFRRQYDY